MPSNAPKNKLRALTPAEQLRIHLTELKGKGYDFDYSWELAQRRIFWPHDRQSRAEWKQAVVETRAVWSECYSGIGDALSLDQIIEVLLCESVLPQAA